MSRLTKDNYKILKKHNLIGRIADNNISSVREDVKTQNYHKLVRELKDIQTACAAADWDGYDALPISENTVARAICFLELLDPSLGIPDIVPEPTGEIGFAWEREGCMTLLISLGPKTIDFIKTSSYISLQGKRSAPCHL